MSARARQPRQDRRRGGQRSRGGGGVVGPRRGSQVTRDLQGLGDRGRPGRGGAVERVGRPHHQLFGVVGAVVPPALALGVGEMLQRDVEQSGGGVQPAFSPVIWCSVSSPVASIA